MAKQKIDRSEERIVLFTGMYQSMKRFMTVDQFGHLWIAIHEYYIDGTEPDDDNPCAFAFSVYKNQFRLNDGRSETSAGNGKNGGRPKKEKENLNENLNNLDEKVGSKNKPKEPAFMNNEHRTMNNEQLKDETQTEKEVVSERVPSFDACKAAREFEEIYKKAGRRNAIEREYARALQKIKLQYGYDYPKGHEAIKKSAAAYITFTVKAGTEFRYMPNPETWLSERMYETDWLEKAKEIKVETTEKAKGGINNGKSNTARAYTDAARKFVDDIESQLVD